MWKIGLGLVLAVTLLTGGCTPEHTAGVPRELRDEVGAIVLMPGTPEREYIELGYIRRHFLPIFTGEEMAWKMKMEAHSRFGDRADAIIRVHQTVVVIAPPHAHIEVSGTVVQFK
jgi:hypothetical protein